MVGKNQQDIDVQVDLNVIKAAGRDGALIGSIDQGTSSTRFLVYTKQGRIAASAQMEHTQCFPSGRDKVGWHEHDPLEIWNNTVSCVEAVNESLKKQAGIDLEKRILKAVGVTNQRETTIAWNSVTGVPYYNAIVWDDLRTTEIAAEVAAGDVDRLREKTGLPLASYFAGTKVKWLLDNVDTLQSDLNDPMKREQIRFGTIDTWLVYQLTGTKSKAKGAANTEGVFVTDVSNASRWLFMDICTTSWDQELVDTVCAPHSVPKTALPEIVASSEVIVPCPGDDAGVPILKNVPIASILGDQQAALFGQCAFTPGEAKNTYGTGLFLMMNTGKHIVPSTHGLLTTVAYKLGAKEPVQYALEGSVSHSGSTIQWLRDQLCIIQDAPESEKLARTTESNDGLYFVPAFAGLFAPYWRSDARACIVGMTASHHKGHICRAALEAAAYQTREVFDAMYKDSSVQLKALKVDGGGTANKLLMQFQSDIINVDVIRPVVMETTSRGAAFAAGLAVSVWKDLDEIRELWTAAETFKPLMTEEKRYQYWVAWKKAVSKSMGWMDVDIEDDDVGSDGYATAEEEETLDEAEAKIPAEGKSSGTFSGTTIGLVSISALVTGFLIGLARARK